MRSRAPALVLASLLALAIAPAAASAAEVEGANIAPYKIVVDNADEAAILGDIGYDMHESGYDNGDTSSQELAVYLSPKEAATLEARGVDDDGRRRSSRRRRRAWPRATARTRSSTSGARTPSRAASPTRCARRPPPTRTS